MANILIDTNVFLDIILKREKASDAYDAIAKIIKSRDTALVSSNTLTDIYYVANRILHNEELARAAVSFVSDIAKVAAIEKPEIRDALSYDMPDFEDAVIAAVAKKYNAKCIITNNVKHFKNSPVPVVESGKY